MAVEHISAVEFLAGASFSLSDSYTFFALILVGGVMLWSAWTTYSLWRTNREDKGGTYTDIDLISSMMQLMILLTLVMTWVAF